MHRVLHRALSGTAAALTAVAVVTAPGTPALAAEPALRLHFPDLSVAGSTPKVNPLFAWIDVPGSTPVVAGKLTLSIDTADVADLATVSATTAFDEVEEQSCARQGTVLSCTLPGPIALAAGSNLVPLAVLEITAKAGAAPDADGKLAFSARLDDGPAATAQSTVTIGEGVDLAGIIAKPKTVAPGSTAAAEVRVSNVGAAPVKGVVLVIVGWDPSLTASKGFSNCSYGVITVCTFDQELATGATYELATPMTLKIPADAAAGSRASALGSWYTPSDFQELIDAIPGGDGGVLGPKGTGGAVSLKVVPAKKTSSLAAAGQVDTRPGNNLVYSEIVVGGGRKPDLAAVGATVSGSAGDKVRTRLGFTNNGPGTLYHWTFENTDPGVHVFVPKGLTAVGVDERCIPNEEEFDEDLTGAAEYLCFLEVGKTKAKASSLFDFTFQVRADASAEPGKVRINDDLGPSGTNLDRNPGNDTAVIAVQLNGGGGGGLPVTGANAGLLGAAGGLLLLAGAASLLLMRRRRVRFTA